MKEFKKDQHVVCKFAGDNGDLIVARIVSVRSNGHVQLVNLLTEKSSLKEVSILYSRNAICSKREALQVRDIYREGLNGSSNERTARSRARSLAVQIAARTNSDATHSHEVMRASDIEAGGTETDKPPVPGARFDAVEKRWIVRELVLSNWTEIASDISLHWTPQGIVVLVKDTASILCHDIELSR